MSNEWISVKKGLPTTNKSKCIVTNNLKAKDAFGQMSHIWIVSLIQKDGKSFSAYYDNDVIIKNITHWMRLPSATIKY